VRRFRQGDLQARIRLSSGDELSQLATIFNEMADTLLQNIEELQRMEKLRRELVANVSHDLRTPIATVHGYAETILLKKDSLSEAERDRYTGIILQSTGRLRRMVEELFDLSRLQAREVSLRRKPFVLGELLHEVYEKLTIIARQKGVAFHCQLCENPTVVFADVALLERVLQNLTENAIKYTPPGGTVTLRLDKRGDVLRVSVTDSGPGIPRRARVRASFLNLRRETGDRRPDGKHPAGAGFPATHERGKSTRRRGPKTGPLPAGFQLLAELGNPFGGQFGNARHDFLSKTLFEHQAGRFFLGSQLAFFLAFLQAFLETFLVKIVFFDVNGNGHLLCQVKYYLP
jgi:hypothetical protein